MRQHTPPKCHCAGCDDGRRGGRPHHVELRVAQIPAPSKDVAELLKREGGAAAYEAMIADARPGPSWLIAHLDDVAGHDLSTVQGEVAACEDMVDVLLRQHPIARSQYVRELAEKLGVGEHEIRQTLNQTVRDRQTFYAEHPEQRPRQRVVRAG
jgi:DNA primase